MGTIDYIYNIYIQLISTNDNFDYLETTLLDSTTFKSRLLLLLLLLLIELFMLRTRVRSPAENAAKSMAFEPLMIDVEAAFCNLHL